MATVAELKSIASQVRRDIVRMVHAVQSGHPGGSLGCADYFTALYFEIMKLNPSFDMDGKNEDIFFLSNGHISPVWYSVLARKGYFPIEELKSFRKINAMLQGHPATAEHTPGVRIASGSLGQGLSAAIGAANAKKLNNDNHLVYVLMGDGEIQEGQVWEAAMYAGAKKVNNIIATIDVNGQQIDGSTDHVLALGSIEDKWKAFGWDVFHMNGNDMEDILKVMAEAKSKALKDKPIIILMKTDMGHGVDFMVGTHEWHGIAPNDDQLTKALAQLEESIGDY